MTIEKKIDTFNNKIVKVYSIGGSYDPTTCCKIENEDDEDKISISDYLKDMVDRNISQQLEELVIGLWAYSFETSCQEAIDFLVENKASFPKLKHFFCGEMTYEECEISWIYQCNYEKFLNAYDQLETFRVRGGTGLELGNVQMPSLKTLIIETGGLGTDVVQSIIDAKPSLQNLEIWFGTEDYGAGATPETIKDLLEGEPFPKLKFLGLKNSQIQDDIAEVLIGQEIVSRIETLDFSMGVLRDRGAQFLFDNKELLKLKHLNCRYNFLSKDWKANLTLQFHKQNINLEDTQETDDDWFYVEVGE